jgi:hypothetical protein
MIRFYYHPTLNPAKIALFLEETGLPYEVVPVDTSKGEQHKLEFRAIRCRRSASDSRKLGGVASAKRSPRYSR